jgi:N-acetyl-gamma-glutamyl-phosphate reductase
MRRAQIVGATGYGGLGMTELLLHHPEIQIQALYATSDVGHPISHFFPHLRGLCDLPVEDVARAEIGTGADVVICATPDRVGMQLATRALGAGARLIDYSGDFRFNSVEQYDRYAAFHPSTGGKAHTAPELLSQSVFGIPELYRDRIRGARIVGNPGCFAVAMILGLAPVAKERVIDMRSIVVDGKTGISGAGKKPTAGFHFPAANDNVTPYRMGVHQHAVEAVQTLEGLAGEKVGLTFVPHVVPTSRGIICTCYVTLREAMSLTTLHDLYNTQYRNEPFIRITPLGATPPGFKTVAGSNLCDITLAMDVPNQRLIVAASIDNLMKGQAGNALQNLNLMFDLPETMGLWRVPSYP